MIDSITQVSQQNNVFGDVSKRTSPRDYWLNSENNTTILNSEDIFVSTSPVRKRSKGKTVAIWGGSIASGIILTAAGIFFFFKGGPKGLVKNFRKFQSYLENKIQKSKLSNEIQQPNKVTEFTLRAVSSMLKRFEAVNNFTTLKDLSLKKGMYKLGKIPKAIHKGITKWFEKIGRQTVVNSYRRTYSRLSETDALRHIMSREAYGGDIAEIIEINGVKQTKAQWLTAASLMNRDIWKIYESRFGAKSLRNRYGDIKRTAKELESHFEMSDLWSTETLNSYVADNAILKQKLAMQKQVKGFRREISYSLSDLYSDAEDRLIKMTELVSYKDIDKIKILRSIKQGVRDYTKAVSPQEKVSAQASLADSFELLRKNISESRRTKSISDKVAKELLQEANELEKSYIGFKQGKVEDVLEIYKHLLPEEKYLALEKSYRASINSLDKSINTETEDFVNKVRDLTMGSAPTDIVSILGAFGTFGYYLKQSENTQEKVSVSLKYGIPAIAGIGTSLICNAKLFAGTKSLLLGAISMFVVGKIGNITDNLYKEHMALKANNVKNDYQKSEEEIIKSDSLPV